MQTTVVMDRCKLTNSESTAGLTEMERQEIRFLFIKDDRGTLIMPRDWQAILLIKIIRLYAPDLIPQN